jgi:hypothetical protein
LLLVLVFECEYKIEDFLPVELFALPGLGSDAHGVGVGTGELLYYVDVAVELEPPEVWLQVIEKPHAHDPLPEFGDFCQDLLAEFKKGVGGADDVQVGQGNVIILYDAELYLGVARHFRLGIIILLAQSEGDGKKFADDLVDEMFVLNR